MQNNNILWVEDVPNFLEYLPHLAKERGKTLVLPKLLARVTFAFDFEMAVELLKKGGFDLHILDGDFPDRLNDARRKVLEEEVAKVAKGGRFDHDIGYTSSEENHYNNFKRLFKEHMSPEMRIVVYSLSDDALDHAFLLGLPFYTKRSHTAEGIREWVQGGIERRYPWKGDNHEEEYTKMIAEWKCGSQLDFVERYLITQ